MSKDSGNYDAMPVKHIIQEMFQLSTKKVGENYCCCYKPLLVIPLDHIILDVFHLILTITDIPANRKLTEVAMQWDDKESSSVTKKDQWKNQNMSENLRQ